MKNTASPDYRPYPGFEFSPEQILRYRESVGFFTFMLKGGSIIHFMPEDPVQFRNWLYLQGISNLNIGNLNNFTLN